MFRNPISDLQIPKSGLAQAVIYLYWNHEARDHEMSERKGYCISVANEMAYTTQVQSFYMTILNKIRGYKQRIRTINKRTITRRQQATATGKTSISTFNDQTPSLGDNVSSNPTQPRSPLSVDKQQSQDVEGRGKDRRVNRSLLSIKSPTKQHGSECGTAHPQTVTFNLLLILQCY